MKNTIFYSRFIIILLLTPLVSNAQEDKLDIEESAEVFLEEYTDEFQEKFFEALKQKSIQNYDRSINLLLECKLLQADDNAVNHELAKTYFLDKEYVLAQEYAIEALVIEPTNYWHLDTLMSILEKQSNSIETVESTVPYSNNKLQENLASIYFKRKKYKEALKVLNKLPASNFKEQLTLKIGDFSNEKKKQEDQQPSIVETEENKSTTKEIELNIKNQIKLEQYRDVEIAAREATETYPLQPFYYYAYGLALYKNNKNKQAIDVLESSLDYLFDDIPLANKIYKVLSDAYTKANNTTKANQYLTKIKPGF